MTREQKREVLWAPLKIWAGLMVLLTATFAYAYVPHGPVKTEVAMAISIAKAGLIAAFFMQLSKATGLVRMAALAGLAWASLLYLFSFADFLTR